MSRKSMRRRPRLAEVRQLNQVLEVAEEAGPRRRAEAVLLHGAGFCATDIAQALQAHHNTIYADLHAFHRHGMAALQRFGQRGLPPALTAAQQARICQLAEICPLQLGLPFARWSLAKLRVYLLRQRVVPAISREHLRRVLKKGACTCAGSSPRCSATIRADGRF